MKKSMLVFTLFALLIGCQANTDSAPPADDPANMAKSSDTALEINGILTDKVWIRTDSTGLPGVLRIFLSDGTLLMDSCWETHRLSEWTMISDSRLRWQEGVAVVTADVLTLGEDELVLRLNLKSGTEVQRFATASVPYLCPDMPR